MSISNKDRSILESESARIIKYLSQHAGYGMNTLSEITEHIYVSNWSNSVEIKDLQTNKIVGIVNVSGVEKPEAIAKKYQKKKIQEMFIKVGDSPQDNIGQFFDSSYWFIHERVHQKGQKVLIHGRQGISRVAAIVAHYFLRRYYLTNYKPKKLERVERLTTMHKFYLLDILKFMKDSRPCMDPNVGFIQQLLLAEYMMKKKINDLWGEYEYRQKKMESREDEPESESESESEINLELQEKPKKINQPVADPEQEEALKQLAENFGLTHSDESGSEDIPDLFA